MSASPCKGAVPTKRADEMTVQIGTVLKVCSFVIHLKEFPVLMFKSMDLVLCAFSAKGIGEWGEEAAEVLSCRDFPWIPRRGGCEIQGTVAVTRTGVRVLGCGKANKWALL